jgi:S1-C subfamily serine protease
LGILLSITFIGLSLEVKIVVDLIDSRKASASVLVLFFAIGLLVSGLGSFYINYRQINSLNVQVEDLQSQVAGIRGSQNQSITNQTITIVQNGTDLVSLFAKVSRSVVLVHGATSSGEVQGSGFVYNYSGRMVVITNFHVVYDTSDLSVTFSNGNGYAAVVLGNDSYADLAVLSVDAPLEEFVPIQIVSSSTLRVGDQVIAIGNPYGLVGSLTTGVVSAVGRSITEEYTGNFSIANIIQTSTPINPGNSGGPLLNAVGDVVGITTAIVSDSQGLGFAIPSNTILREISSLILNGFYRSHSFLGISSSPDRSDMTYDLAKELNVTVTYGRYVGQVTPGGPSDGKLNSGDIIIAMNGTTIKNSDDLGSYLVEKVLPGDKIVVTVVRNNSEIKVTVIVGTRPQAPT